MLNRKLILATVLTLTVVLAYTDFKFFTYNKTAAFYLHNILSWTLSAGLIFAANALRKEKKITNNAVMLIAIVMLLIHTVKLIKGICT